VSLTTGKSKTFSTTFGFTRDTSGDGEVSCLAADFWSLVEVEVSLMAGTTSWTATVVPLANILAVGAVVEAGVVDEELMGAALVLAEEGAGFLSLAEEIAEMVSLTA